MYWYLEEVELWPEYSKKQLSSQMKQIHTEVIDIKIIYMALFELLPIHFLPISSDDGVDLRNL